MILENRTIPGILSSAVGKYLSMRTDDFKTNIVAGLSMGFSRVLAILVITLLLLIVLGVFAFAFILGGVYLIAVLVLVLLRKRLFVNMFSNLFSGIIDQGSPADDLKPLLLKLVRNMRSNLED